VRLLAGSILSLAALAPFAVLTRGLGPLEGLLVPLGALIAITVFLANAWARDRARS
jgi:hypothetical protein